MVETRPPWTVFHGVDPWWGGWRQGDGEAVLDAWLPFWRAATPEERAAYLERWPPPNEDWRTYLLEYWVE